jgi:hypothetical protein
MGGGQATLKSQQQQQPIYASAVKSSRVSMAFQTPLVGKSLLSQFETPGTRRVPREGEEILSANGSPLGVFNTVVKSSKSAADEVPPTPGVFVPLSTGGLLDLNDDIDGIDVGTLSKDAKQDALVKMQAMMSNMQKLIDKLGSSNA